MTTEELWEEYKDEIKAGWIRALKEYGAAVRKRDAEILNNEVKRLNEIDGCYQDDADYVSSLAAAIEATPLP